MEAFQPLLNLVNILTEFGIFLERQITADNIVRHRRPHQA